MIRCSSAAIGMVALTLSISAAHALSGNYIPNTSDGKGTLFQRVHSLGEAERSLYRLGYYDIRVERSSLPYSFNACKRGRRYHIHVDYHGTLTQVDRIGSCEDYADDPDYYGRRSDYGRRPYRRW